MAASASGSAAGSSSPGAGRSFPRASRRSASSTTPAGSSRSIEINGTYYGSQKPASFRKWHEETPDDFVFAVKGPRFATNRKVLAEAGESIERFFASGVMELKDKLGPVNWQFMATKKFEPDDFAAFLALLPKEVDGRPIRHAVEVRHASFRAPEFVALAREHGVAVSSTPTPHFPQIADVTAPFVYARIMGTEEDEPAGYSAARARPWAARARLGRRGRAGRSRAVAPPAEAAARDVFLYVISGAKRRNPAAAMALIERTG